ncbi:hypothetical protein ABH922_004512 [Rhodococcus sp. 27YEA15]|uniref:hypothetical protein n=1 Tax=Rhodococcus sp. 27YEA15 TaxID=3156259 RepID=UPI003C7C9333
MSAGPRRPRDAGRLTRLHTELACVHGTVRPDPDRGGVRLTERGEDRFAASGHDRLGQGRRGVEAITANAVFGTLKAARSGDVSMSDHFFGSSYRVALALLDDFEAALQKLKR